MEIIEITTNYKSESDCFIALGNFDGVHLAHKKLLDTLVETSKPSGCKSAILAFKNHTKNIINKSPQRLLTSNEQKYSKLEDIGIDICYEIMFNYDLMRMSARDFVVELLYNNLKVKGIVVGFDYRFGHKASGDIYLLKELCNELGIALTILDEVIIDENIVSSTLIRNLIEDGKVDEVNKYLGSDFKINGTVIHGKKLGTRMGIPTANIAIDTNYVIPKYGVYDSTVIVDGVSYKSATNVGKNPSIENSGLRIESHIIDFDEDIYDKKIELILHKFLRDELKFESVEELFNQMAKDIELIKNSSIAKNI